MVGVAQLVEHGIVTPVVEGSIPFVHPIFREAPDLTVWRLFCFSGSSVKRLHVLGRRGEVFIVFMFLDDAVSPVGPLEGSAVRDGLPVSSIYRRIGAKPWHDWLYLLTGRGTTVCPRL